MNPGMQCKAGMTPERELEQLAVGEDAQLTHLSRLVGSMQGISDRLVEAQKFLFDTGRWSGESASLARDNLGVMQRNLDKFAVALDARRLHIQQQNIARRNKAQALLSSLPPGIVPSYVHDALNRNDVSVQTPFGSISLNEGAEKVADLFGNQRSNDAVVKLGELRQFIAGQSTEVTRDLVIDIEQVKTGDGSTTKHPVTVPGPDGFSPTLPSYPSVGGIGDGGPGGPHGDGNNGGGGNDDGRNDDGRNNDDHDTGNDDTGNNDDVNDDGNDGGNNDGGNNDNGNNDNGRGPSVDGDLGGPGGGGGIGAGVAGGGLGALGIAAGARLAGIGGGSGAFGRVNLGTTGPGAGIGLRGGVGMAAGVGGSGTAPSTGGSGGAGRVGGMLGAGGAGGSEEKKKPVSGLGYLAPKFEDEGDGGPAADASRAGRRSDS